MTMLELHRNWHAINSEAGMALLDMARPGATTLVIGTDHASGPDCSAAVDAPAPPDDAWCARYVRDKYDPIRCVVHTRWDGTPRPRNKAAMKAAKQHKAATRRAGKR